MIVSSLLVVDYEVAIYMYWIVLCEPMRSEHAQIALTSARATIKILSRY